MSNWELLSDKEYQEAWNYIHASLSFRPDEKEDLIKIPYPSFRFDVSGFYEGGFNEGLYTDLHLKAKDWLINIANGERIYAVDWMHDCYSFYPDKEFELNEFDEWLIPIFPNGDYLFFLTKDFKNGIFSDGIGLTISLFGVDLLNIVNARPAKMLSTRIF